MPVDRESPKKAGGVARSTLGCCRSVSCSDNLPSPQADSKARAVWSAFLCKRSRGIARLDKGRLRNPRSGAGPTRMHVLTLYVMYIPTCVHT